MRILIVTQYFWPESFRINDLALALKSRGHEISVLTGIPNYPAGKIFEGFGFLSFGYSDYNGIKILRVPLFARRQGKSWQLALNFLSFAFSACLLGPLLCRDEYDIVFVYEPSPFTVGLPGALMRRLKKAPLLFWVQDLWPESLYATGAIKSPWLLKMVGVLVCFIYKRCDRVLIQSRGFMQPAVNAGASADRLHYFPNWAEDIFQPIEVKRKSPEDLEMPNGFRILFAGNLGTAQSLETIISAANRLKDMEDIHWVILGDGRRELWLREQIIKNGLEKTVHVLGRRPVEQMPCYFSLVDVLLVTLRKDYIFSLTIPSKIQSYLAVGKAIVGALDGEGAEIVKESGAGLVGPAEDSKRLARSVMNLYSMAASQRNEMGARGRHYYNQHFKRELLVEELEELMDRTISDSLR